MIRDLAALPQRTCTAKRIAIIGAGPSGLAAAKYLMSEKFFDTIEIFEQRAHLGGLWKFTSQNSGDGFFAVPQTNAHIGLEDSIRPVEHGVDANSSANPRSEYLSPIYEKLETNIPTALMGYSDHPWGHDIQLFPQHAQVQDYLEHYGEDLVSRIYFKTQVIDVRFFQVNERTGQDEWTLKYKELDKPAETAVYNAVVVANGHYAVPYIPEVPTP